MDGDPNFGLRAFGLVLMLSALSSCGSSAGEANANANANTGPTAQPATTPELFSASERRAEAEWLAKEIATARDQYVGGTAPFRQFGDFAAAPSEGACYVRAGVSEINDNRAVLDLVPVWGRSDQLLHCSIGPAGAYTITEKPLGERWAYPPDEVLRDSGVGLLAGMRQAFNIISWLRYQFAKYGELRLDKGEATKDCPGLASDHYEKPAELQFLNSKVTFTLIPRAGRLPRLDVGFTMLNFSPEVRAEGLDLDTGQLFVFAKRADNLAAANDREAVLRSTFAGVALKAAQAYMSLHHSKISIDATRPLPQIGNAWHSFTRPSVQADDGLLLRIVRSSGSSEIGTFELDRSSAAYIVTWD